MEISEPVKECPFCHGSSITKVENDQYGDLYFCEKCEHRFRYDPMVNFISKNYTEEINIQTI